MTKTEFINEVADTAGMSRRAATSAVNAFIDVVTCALTEGEEVQIIGFGTFDVVQRAARIGMNLQTGEKMQIPEKLSPRFKAGKRLKDAVREG